jgi:O-antigen ligase
MILSGFRSSTRLFLCLAGIILLGAILALSFGTDRTQDKWRQSSLKDEGRLLTYRTILQDTLPLTGYWGTGPGSFESVFQSVVENNHLPVQGRWDKAHNDHLQTLLEWGAPGYLCWGLLLGGALIRGFVLSRRGDGLPPRMLGACGVLSLSGVILHALGDFPLQIPSLLLVTLCIAGLLWGTEIPPLRTRS